MEGAAAHARLVEGVQVGTGLDQDAGSLEKKSLEVCHNMVLSNNGRAHIAVCMN